MASATIFFCQRIQEAQENETALRVAGMYGKVAVQTLHLLKDSTKQQVKEALEHPLATAADTTLLFTLPSLYLAKAVVTAYQNSNSLKKAAATFSNMWSNHPEQAAALTTALAVEFALTGKLLGYSSKMFDKMAAKACKLGERASGRLLTQMQREVAFAGDASLCAHYCPGKFSNSCRVVNRAIGSHYRCHPRLDRGSKCLIL